MSNFLDASEFKKVDAIIGCDEAGRGPIAGPVVGCALQVNKKNLSILKLLEDLGVGDSKKISPKKRSKILSELKINLNEIKPGQIHEIKGLRFCLWEADSTQIDKINILQASLFCMKSSFEALARTTKLSVLAVVDGNKSFESNYNSKAVIKGDSKYLTVGLASIIAKEFRDEKMRKLDALYPGYELKKHAGYPTAAHKALVASLGPSPIHRLSFKGVKEYVGVKGR